MEHVRPSQLRTAARVADALVYAVGVAGVVAGGLLWRDGDVAFAVVAWAVTFVAGAGLRLAAWLTRGVAQLLDRSERISDELAALRADHVVAERRAPEAVDPYSRDRWGSGWH
jgi:hypothetical protein